jgi:adenylate cyclase
VIEAVVILSVLLGLCLSATAVLWVRLRRARRKVARLEEQAVRRDRPATAPARGARAVKAVVESAVDTAARVRDQGVSGMLMSSIEDLARWAREDQTEITRLAGPDGNVTILFSDIESSTGLNEQLGDKAWVKLLGAHDRLVRSHIEPYGGHIVKSQGDGFMIAFREPADAVRASIDVQDALNAGRDRRLRRTPIRVRVGVHCGTAIERDGDLFGRNVAMAARVAAQAAGGEILVSDDVRLGLRDVDDIVLLDVREAELKGLPGVHRLWQVAVV